MFSFESKLPYWINRAAFLLRAELHREFGKAGYALTPEEWALLMVLWERAPLTVGALADLTLRDRTTVTRLLDGLVKKHCVIRSSDPRDRRRLQITVSEFGSSLTVPLRSLAEIVINRALQGIPEEDVGRCADTLKIMITNFDEKGKRPRSRS